MYLHRPRMSHSSPPYWTPIFQKCNDFTAVWRDGFTAQNVNRKILTTMQATLFACSRCGLLWKSQLLRAFVHVCAMAMDCYFSSVEKVPNYLAPCLWKYCHPQLLPAILQLLQQGWHDSSLPTVTSHIHKCGIHVPQILLATITALSNCMCNVGVVRLGLKAWVWAWG